MPPVFYYFLFFIFSSPILNNVHCENVQKPNIIIILADDLGWNDVGFHGSKMFQTPNIDALAYNGIILNQFYSLHLCTPSRTALMTGKYPIRTGMQHDVLTEAEPRGLPLDLKLLPQYLKKANYKTHLVGKWHLGFFEADYTPTKRGFDTFFGYYNGHQDYFSHRVHETKFEFEGYDLHDGLSTYWETENIYGTDLYTSKATELIYEHDKTNPMFLLLSQIAVHAGENSSYFQAPEEEIKKFDYITDDPNRKIFAAMVSKLDESVAKVIFALNEREMLNNSLIIFMSDNGAPTFGIYETTGSNYPLRGMKNTYFEGGTRLPAVIWSPLLKTNQRVSNNMMHMVDILPTLCGAAGITLDANEDIDGIDMWESLLDASEESIRDEIVYNIDPAEAEISAGAVRIDKWKYYKGNSESEGDQYEWPGDKYGVKNYSYTFAEYYTNILESSVNLIISNIIGETYQHSSTELPSSDESLPNEQTSLTKEKIEKLKEDAEVTCKSLSLPLCNSSSDCLINLNEDPCERYNFAGENPDIYKNLKNKFEHHRRETVPAPKSVRDPCANPKLWGDQWINWYDFQFIGSYHSVTGIVEQIYTQCYTSFVSLYYYVTDGTSICLPL